MEKVGRNDPCPCGSGKKFKKCCERKMIKGKFLAQKSTQTSNLSSFFRQNVAKETPFTLKGRSITIKSNQPPVPTPLVEEKIPDQFKEQSHEKEQPPSKTIEEEKKEE